MSCRWGLGNVWPTIYQRIAAEYNGRFSFCCILHPTYLMSEYKEFLLE